jgi:hypothetical protein
LYTSSTGAFFNPSTGKLTLLDDASISGLTVGKGGGAIASNTAVGLSALAANTTGTENIAVGISALQQNTTGSFNNAFGRGSLNKNTTGAQNVGYGRNTLFNNLTGDFNVAVGNSALQTNTTGSNNTASGFQALFSNTTGSNNTASGYQALFNNTTGSGNTDINPMNSAGVYSPLFAITTQNDRFMAGSGGVTNAYVKVAWTVTSDARDKTNIAPVPLGLDFVKQLEPVKYQFRIDRETDDAKGPVRYGFLAQDILAVEGDNSVIIDDEDPDHLKMNDSSLLSVMVNAIKELTARLEALEANNTAV